MAMHLDEALKALYGDAVRDLTAQGYTQALGQVRKVDPARARRIERLLAPLLKERIFRRRSRVWHEASEGRRARVALLPGNPHVQTDVHTIRGVLAIPAGHLHATEDDLLWKQVGKAVRPQAVRRVVEGHLAACWLQVHRKAAIGQMAGEEDEEVLPPELLDSAVASAKVRLGSNEVPEWLRHPPCGPGPYHNPAAPMDWATGRLVERHRLPWHAGVPLAFYILTQDPDWVTRVEPFQVDVTYEGHSSGDQEAFTVSVKGVDEFMTKADWDHMWDQYVRPRQESLWERRGMQPKGRRTVDIARLQEAMPLYREMVHKSLTMAQLIGRAPEEWDQETIRRSIHDLRELLSPVP